MTEPCMDPLESCAEEEAHFGHSLLQANLHISRQVVASSDRRQLHEQWVIGLQLVLMLAVPFALAQVVVCSLLACWVNQGRNMLSKDIVKQDPSAGSPGQSDQVQHDRELPSLVAWFANAGMFLLQANFTIVMPGSEQIMIEAGGNTFLSGVSVGAYAMGSIACLPLLVHLSRYSYRTAIVFMGVVAVLGNLIYAIMGSVHGPEAVLGLILARIVCGVEGGMIIVFSNIVLQLSSGTCVVSAWSTLLLCGSLGLVFGPSASSLSQLCLPWLPPELPPAILMILFAGVYGICGAIWFPSQDDCFKMVGLQGCPTAVEGKAVYSDLQLRASWLSVGLQSVVQLSRFFQRVSWEAGALLIFVGEYHLTERYAGLLIAVPVLASIPLSTCVGWLHARLGSTLLIRATCLMELVGMLLMLRLQKPTPGYLVLYLIGSSVFYSANWISNAPFSPLRKKYARKGHWLLNLETSTSLIWVFGFVGYFYGPVLARAVLSRCTHQNILTMASIVVWIGSTLGIEIGMHVLLACTEGA